VGRSLSSFGHERSNPGTHGHGRASHCWEPRRLIHATVVKPDNLTHFYAVGGRSQRVSPGQCEARPWHRL
jgi:hypothetical protein